MSDILRALNDPLAFLICIVLLLYKAFLSGKKFLNELSSSHPPAVLILKEGPLAEQTISYQNASSADHRGREKQAPRPGI